MQDQLQLRLAGALQFPNVPKLLHRTKGRNSTITYNILTSLRMCSPMYMYRCTYMYCSVQFHCVFNNSSTHSLSLSLYLSHPCGYLLISNLYSFIPCTRLACERAALWQLSLALLQEIGSDGRLPFSSSMFCSVQAYWSLRAVQVLVSRHCS